MVYSRTIYPELLLHAKTPLVTVLTGMRRTGKTTLVGQLLRDLSNKNALFLDLQRPDNRELFSEKNYDRIYDAFIARGLTKSHPMVVALDELQLAPEASSAIKYLVDHFGVKFIVTGSSSYYLKHLFTESLAGRKKIFELLPLDFGEFLTFKNVPFTRKDWRTDTFDRLEYERLSSYYEEYIRFGGFPQVVLAGSEAEKRDILSDIMSSYINIDIRSLADFSDERNVYALAKLLAGRVGSRVEFSTLSRLSGLSRPTVTNYVSFLEKTYCIRTIPVFTRNSGREIVKARKLYFCDTGLANILAELSSGAQFENTVCHQLVSQGTLQYYAKKTGQEVDFVLDGSSALEAKETPTENDAKVLSRIAASAGVSQQHLIGRYRSPSFDGYVWGGSLL